ncbi:hypothetical protein V5799_017510 [Amblyomma americanum]|uniref:Uncharacterized protein n=1 Tax=Amblyomma americanum TaxID=6943 RepID=A0AAQ4F361_AMBAM
MATEGSLTHRVERASAGAQKNETETRTTRGSTRHRRRILGRERSRLLSLAAGLRLPGLRSEAHGNPRASSPVIAVVACHRPLCLAAAIDSADPDRPETSVPQADLSRSPRQPEYMGVYGVAGTAFELLAAGVIAVQFNHFTSLLWPSYGRPSSGENILAEETLYFPKHGKKTVEGESSSAVELLVNGATAPAGSKQTGANRYLDDHMRKGSPPLSL